MKRSGNAGLRPDFAIEKITTTREIMCVDRSGGGVAKTVSISLPRSRFLERAQERGLSALDLAEQEALAAHIGVAAIQTRIDALKARAARHG